MGKLVAENSMEFWDIYLGQSLSIGFQRYTLSKLKLLFIPGCSKEPGTLNVFKNIPILFRSCRLFRVGCVIFICSCDLLTLEIFSCLDVPSPEVRTNFFLYFVFLTKVHAGNKCYVVLGYINNQYIIYSPDAIRWGSQLTAKLESSVVFKNILWSLVRELSFFWLGAGKVICKRNC